jgi:hypothetical protein
MVRLTEVSAPSASRPPPEARASCEVKAASATEPTSPATIAPRPAREPELCETRVAERVASVAQRTATTT